MRKGKKDEEKDDVSDSENTHVSFSLSLVALLSFNEKNKWFVSGERLAACWRSKMRETTKNTHFFTFACLDKEDLFNAEFENAKGAGKIHRRREKEKEREISDRY